MSWGAIWYIHCRGKSAGLIPIVPDIGGQTEFVPSRFHFHTFVEAIQIILFALDVDDSERIRLSNSVRKFSANCKKN
jgi:hypothetical protein